MFRVMKTKGFDIEAHRMAGNRPFDNLAAATVIAAAQRQQMPRDRDGRARRPMQDLFDPTDQPVIAAISHTLEGTTERQKSRIRPARSPSPHGSAPASAAGPDTAARQDLSCSYQVTDACRP
jgi:hypothetical protein